MLCEKMYSDHSSSVIKWQTFQGSAEQGFYLSAITATYSLQNQSAGFFKVSISTKTRAVYFKDVAGHGLGAAAHTMPSVKWSEKHFTSRAPQLWEHFHCNYKVHFLCGSVTDQCDKTVLQQRPCNGWFLEKITDSYSESSLKHY